MFKHFFFSRIMFRVQTLMCVVLNKNKFRNRPLKNKNKFRNNTSNQYLSVRYNKRGTDINNSLNRTEQQSNPRRC